MGLKRGIAEPPHSRHLRLEALEDRSLLSIGAVEATGLLPPSPADIAWQNATATVVQQVRLNQFGLNNVNASRASQGLPPLTAAQVDMAPTGEEAVGETADQMAAQGGAAKPSDSLAGSFPITPMPSSIDLTKLTNCFPPIADQGQIGDCVAYSTTYYAATYETALAHGWNETTANPATSSRRSGRTT